MEDSKTSDKNMFYTEPTITAKEIYNLPNCPSVNIIEAMDFALIEYRKSILGLVDEGIELYQDHYSARKALTELKQKIQNDKRN